MRYLIISCFLLIVSCASYPKKQELTATNTLENTITNPYFSDTNQDYVYKASIQVYNHSFGGLLIIKKIRDQNHRVVFTTEMGAKLFDFSFTEDDFQVNYIIDKLDKKLLITILKRDFKALIQEKTQVIESYTSKNSNVYQTSILNKKHYYYVSKQLDKIVRTGHQNEKVHFLFTDISNNIANNIRMVHSTIKLEITLKSIY